MTKRLVKKGMDNYIKEIKPTVIFNVQEIRINKMLLETAWLYS